MSNLLEYERNSVQFGMGYIKNNPTTLPKMLILLIKTDPKTNNITISKN
jgi:hypothetical protein